jgi:hypothetical protein
MSYVPKYILKRIVPKNGVANLDLSGDGKTDAIGVKYVNIISPLEIPADSSAADILAQFKGVNIDDEWFTDPAKLKLWFDGEILTLNDFDKIAGKTLPVGGMIVIIMEKDGGVPAGKHEFGMKTEYNGQESHNKLTREVPPEIKKLVDLTG